MAKSYKTIFLEKKIKKYFQDEFDETLYGEMAVYPKPKIYDPYYEPRPIGAVDLGTQIISNNKPYDLGIEIKVSRTDLCSKNGHNHYLDINYLAVPDYLVENAKRYLDSRNLLHVGLISVSGKGEVKIIRHFIILEQPKSYIDLSTEEYEGF